MKSLDTQSPKPRKRGLSALLLAGYSALLIAGGIWIERSGDVPSELTESNNANPVDVSAMSTETVGVKPTSPPNRTIAPGAIVLKIDLDSDSLALLKKKRAKAVKRNWLVSDKNDYLQSQLEVENQNTQAKLRLEGGNPAFWQGDKWSLRVKTVDTLAGIGFSEFTLRAPEAQGISRDWFLNLMLRYEGVVTGRQKFVNVVLNGENRGVFLLAEILSERSSNGGPLLAGPVIRFDDQLGWAEAARREAMRMEEPRVSNGSGEFLSAETEVFDSGRWLKNEANYVVLTRALTLLDGFRRGEFTTSETFNRRKLARFLAVTDLLGATPAASWRNLSFHYDHTTARLEPLGFDAGGNGLRPTKSLASGMSLAVQRGLESSLADDHLWFERIFDDPGFYQTYITALGEISKSDYVNTALEELQPSIDQALSILSTDYPDESFRSDILLANRKYIRSLLDPKQSVRAHLIGVDKNVLTLAVGNLLNMPIEVLEVQLDKNRVARTIDGSVLINARAPNQAIAFQLVQFNAIDVDWTDEQKAGLEIRTKVLGVDERNRDKVIAKAPLSYAAGTMHPPEPNFRDIPGLDVDDAARTVTFPRRRFELKLDLVLPAGWTLLAGPGTTIDLTNSAAIISNSAIKFNGDSDDPIRITTSDGTGQGLCVVDAEHKSTFKYVEISDLRSVSRQGWEIPGAVTFYRSNFKLEKTRFSNIHSEDALTAVQAKFKLEDCSFENVDSDGFDTDSCEGKIIDCIFLNSTDDAIDLAGSFIQIENVSINTAGDKGVSAGEDCRIECKQIKIENCPVALAAKNRSHITIDGADITQCAVGLSAYQNNDDSGPGAFFVTNVDFYNTKEKFDIKKGSSLEVDGEQVKGPSVR